MIECSTNWEKIRRSVAAVLILASLSFLLYSSYLCFIIQDVDMPVGMDTISSKTHFTGKDAIMDGVALVGFCLLGFLVGVALWRGRDFEP